MVKKGGPGSSGKKNGGRRLGASSTNPNRLASSKSASSGPSLRSKATIQRLNMYRSKVKRDKSGSIVKGGLAVGASVAKMLPARVEPDRRWFGNTRVVGQQELQEFKQAIDRSSRDPYAVLLKRHKLPMGLLAAGGKVNKGTRVDLLGAQPFAQTFGRKAQRKRPKLDPLLARGAEGAAHQTEEEAELGALLASAVDRASAYDEGVDSNLFREAEAVGPRNYIFDAGQSRRIRAELFKVRARAARRDTGSSSEARPSARRRRSSTRLMSLWPSSMRATRSARARPTPRSFSGRRPSTSTSFSFSTSARPSCCASVRALAVLAHRARRLQNRCDLVPTRVTAAWLKLLSREAPTIAFHASITNPFGKGALINLLRQFAKLHTDKKQISVGFIGYPNVRAPPRPAVRPSARAVAASQPRAPSALRAGGQVVGDQHA